MELTSLQNGRYKIESILGQGGFGITYRAVQTSLGRTVAIKEFFMKDYCERAEGSTHVTMGTQSSREMVQRYRDKFEKEARTLARLKHPHIIPVIDVFQENNTSYYVMEYAEGASLKQQVDEKGPLSEARAVNYILQVADALRYLHGQHICHLDIKPANILTTAHGEAILADFGLAKQYDEEGGETSTTPVGKSKGYAPPEQYRTGGVQSFSPETDVYALGATLYKMLTGSTPPPAADILNNGFPADALSVRGVNAKIVACITRAMSPVRKARYQSVDAFLEALGVETQAEPPLPKDATDEETRPMPVPPPMPSVPHVRKAPPAPKPKPAASGSVWSRYPWWMKAMLVLGLLWSGWFVVLGVGNTFLEHYDSRWPVYLLVASCLGLASCIQLFRGQKSGFWLLMASVLAVYLLLALVYDGGDWFVPIMYSFGPIVLLPLFAIRGKDGKRMFFMLR